MKQSNSLKQSEMATWATPHN